ncbi:MAG: YebC/PmpR family DNA-binding transcriptional regulator, partial [Burkholderiales bacterium]|nr:YebC/PmpR family DNA-binding transcriptional regulator [Burkholderiales bacterium]
YEFITVKEALEKAGFKAEMGEVTMKPQAETEILGDDVAKMQKLLDMLENLDDAQAVYTTAVMDEEE